MLTCIPSSDSRGGNVKVHLEDYIEEEDLECTDDPLQPHWPLVHDELILKTILSEMSDKILHKIVK